MATELKKRADGEFPRQLSKRSPWRINASAVRRASDANSKRGDRGSHTTPGLSMRRRGKVRSYSMDRDIRNTGTRSPLDRLFRSPLERPHWIARLLRTKDR